MPMLNKEICKKCYEESVNGWKWDEHNEAVWNAGEVWCVRWAFKIDDPPEWCFYRLEHLMSEQDEAE